MIRHTGGTPLLVHPDLLGSMTGARALDRVLCEGTGCGDDGVLGGDKGRGTCTEANGVVIGCSCGDGVRLVVRDFCGITMREGTGDEGAGGKASGKRSMDQLERQIGESSGDCCRDKVGDTLGEETGVFTPGATVSRWSSDRGTESVMRESTARLGGSCTLVILAPLNVSSKPRGCVLSRLWFT